MQTPTIQSFPEMTFMGMKAEMSLVQNLTGQLWSRFMPRRDEVPQRIGTDLYSIELYDPSYFRQFNPSNIFEKWAAVQVESAGQLPKDMEVLVVPKGKYAVFRYKGTPAGMKAFYEYVLGQWLPNSIYQLDHRPHMAIMGKAYRNNHPDSEEDICFPVRQI